jgi:hypothetical protein
MTCELMSSTADTSSNSLSLDEEQNNSRAQKTPHRTHRRFFLPADCSCSENYQRSSEQSSQNCITEVDYSPYDDAEYGDGGDDGCERENVCHDLGECMYVGTLRQHG